jgi:putative methyltransferase (TIGR04325 family)
MELAPIVIFTYNRPDKTLKVIESLKKNQLAKYSNLYVFCDGINKSKKDDFFKVNCVIEIIKNTDGFKNIKLIQRNKNLGLYKNITLGLDYIFKKNKKAIILEDDIIVSPNFLKYMNDCLIMYENDNEVGSICSNLSKNKEKLPSTFFLYHQDCWGWGAWRRSWKLFDHNNKRLLKKIKDQGLEKKFNFENKYNFTRLLIGNQLKKRSWAVNWYASLLVHKKLSLYSSIPMSKNIGLGENSTNSKMIFKVLDVARLKKNIKYKKIKIEESQEGYKAIINFYAKNQNIKPINLVNKLRIKVRWVGIIIKNFFSKRKNNFFFTGPFDNWEDALKNSEGYENKKIIEKLFKSAMKVKNKKFAYERDTVLFSKPSYDWLILHNILKHCNNHKNLNLIDFGGSLGSTYFQHKFFFVLFKSIKWNIVEQKKISSIGKKFFKNKNLNFYDDLRVAMKENAPKFILLNNVLQYIENPLHIINLLSRYKGITIIIDKIIFTKQDKDIIIVQKTPKRIYEASYPLRIFSKSIFLKKIKKHFKIVENKKNNVSFNIKFNNNYYKSEYLIIKS